MRSASPAARARSLPLQARSSTASAASTRIGRKPCASAHSICRAVTGEHEPETMASSLRRAGAAPASALSMRPRAAPMRDQRILQALRADREQRCSRWSPRRAARPRAASPRRRRRARRSRAPASRAPARAASARPVAIAIERLDQCRCAARFVPGEVQPQSASSIGVTGWRAWSGAGRAGSRSRRPPRRTGCRTAVAVAIGGAADDQRDTSRPPIDRRAPMSIAVPMSRSRARNRRSSRPCSAATGAPSRRKRREQRRQLRVHPAGDMRARDARDADARDSRAKRASCSAVGASRNSTVGRPAKRQRLQRVGRAGEIVAVVGEQQRLIGQRSSRRTSPARRAARGASRACSCERYAGHRRLPGLPQRRARRPRRRRDAP